MKCVLLLCSLLIGGFAAFCEELPYGNNGAAGRYLKVEDADIYYEVYGSGKPIVLLHGGVYGYIDEFELFIKRLSQTNQVICIATRGHGKSQAGSGLFSYRQRASDAHAVIRAVTADSVTVIGFSDGAYSAFKLAALYPALVKKLIAIGAGDLSGGQRRKKFDYTPERLLQADSAFFASRLRLMPEPQNWRSILQRLNNMYNEETISRETFAQVICPVLVLSGDRDAYVSTEGVLRCVQTLPHAQLAVIPGCGHVVFFCNVEAVWACMDPFLKE